MYVIFSINTEFCHYEQWEGNEGDSTCSFDIFQILQLTHFIVLASLFLDYFFKTWAVAELFVFIYLKGFKTDLFILNPLCSIIGIFLP